MNDLQGSLSPAEVVERAADWDRQVGTDDFLGWTDFTFKADGERYNVEVEVRGRFDKEFIGEPRKMVITGLFLTGADARVNVLPALSHAQVRAIALEVRPQALLRQTNPEQFPEPLR